MQHKYSNRTILLILLLLLVMIVFFILPGQRVDVKDQPSIYGIWDFYFTYENDTNLIYRGDLKIEEADSLTVTFDIFAPRSNRAEHIVARDIKFEKTKLSGRLIYERYKIRGGFLTEYFEFDFIDQDMFKGKGKCLESCAEGTDQSNIHWYGTRQSNPNN